MFSSKNLALALTASLVSVVSALPIRREVPQEHSHNQFITTVKNSLDLNNPDQILDPVFGLLGNAAASQGQGKITDTDCLQQATADQAFTNAKAAGDVAGMTAALIYRALERNTGKVGLASVPCTSIKAVNPEIAAIQQHQDPASPNAAAINKAITLALAQQINSVGGNPQDALKSGTFAPGNLNDNTGKGNTCDDANDATGCIFTQNLLVEDATAAEIQAAVAGGSAVSIPGATDGSEDCVDSSAGGSASSAASGNQAASGKAASSQAASSGSSSAATAPAASSSKASGSASSSSSKTSGTGSASNSSSGAAAPATPPASSGSGQQSSGAAAPATPPASSGSGQQSSGAAAGANLQKFTGTLGGAPPPVTAGGKGFNVQGSDSFTNLSSAVQRSCDIQHNTCADAANSGAGFKVGDCDKQDQQCVAANN